MKTIIFLCFTLLLIFLSNDAFAGKGLDSADIIRFKNLFDKLEFLNMRRDQIYCDFSLHKEIIRLTDDSIYLAKKALIEEFYSSDKQILLYLASFLKDSSYCFWMLNKNSSFVNYLGLSLLLRVKFINALALIESYLSYPLEYRFFASRISSRPNTSSTMSITLHNVQSLIEWLDKYYDEDVRYIYQNVKRPAYDLYRGEFIRKQFTR